jgi:hypothetical protein
VSLVHGRAAKHERLRISGSRTTSCALTCQSQGSRVIEADDVQLALGDETVAAGSPAGSTIRGAVLVMLHSRVL